MAPREGCLYYHPSPSGTRTPTPWFVARYSAPTELRAHMKPDALYSSLLLGTPAATKHCCLQVTAFRYRFSTGAALQRNPRPDLKNHWGTMFTFIYRCHTDAVASIVEKVGGLLPDFTGCLAGAVTNFMQRHYSRDSKDSICSFPTILLRHWRRRDSNPRAPFWTYSLSKRVPSPLGYSSIG